jgi:hypothetical protein
VKIPSVLPKLLASKQGQMLDIADRAKTGAKQFRIV